MRKTKTILAAACALVFCFAIAGCGGGSGSGGGSDSGGDSGSSTSSNSNSGLSGGSSGSGSSGLNGGSSGSGGSGLHGDTGGSSGGGEQFDTWAEECLTSDGNPTLYAFTELKGWQLKTLVEQQGYKWDGTDLEAYVGPDGSFFDAFDEYGWLDGDIDDLDKAGAGTVCGYMFCYTGYSSTRACFNDISPMVVVDSADAGQNGLVAVVYGPSMVEVPVIMNYDSDNSIVVVLVYSPDAVNTGFITEDLSLSDEIYSLDDFWMYYTGEHLNG